jgi:hypothetical protein
MVNKYLKAKPEPNVKIFDFFITFIVLTFRRLNLFFAVYYINFGRLVLLLLIIG